MFLVLNNMIIEEYKGRHVNYPIGHFNMIGLIYSMANNTEVPTRTVVFDSYNSVYTALRNGSNHDWRTNELRNKLNDYGWLVTSIEQQEFSRLKAMLIERGRIHRRSGDVSEYDRFRIRTENVTKVSFEWPPTSDYQAIHSIRLRAESERETERTGNSSRLTRKLSRDYSCLRTLPPSWIGGKTILMLSGLVVSRDGTLIKGSVELDQIPSGCVDICRYRNSNTINDRWNCETTLHRAFICPRYRGERCLIRRAINQALGEEGTESWSSWKPWNKEGAVETTLRNKRLSQTLLRLLTRVAFRQLRDEQGL